MNRRHFPNENENTELTISTNVNGNIIIVVVYCLFMMSLSQVMSLNPNQVLLKIPCKEFLSERDAFKFFK